jgi:hypothetical protein
LQELMPQNLPRPGDRLECYAELNRPAYLYVVLFSSRGPARVLWPRAARLKDPVRDRYARCPAEGEGKLAIPAGGGVMTMLVAGREKPLDAAGLQRLTTAQFKWPSPRPTQSFPATAFPPLPLAERPGHLVLRGADGVELFDLPRAFKPLVEDLFDTYYAVMFPALDAPDGAGRQGPKASGEATRRRTAP